MPRIEDYSNRRIVDYTPTGKKVTHGYTTYSNHGCRCETCTVGWRRYFAGAKRTMRAELLTGHNTTEPVHGVYTTYNNWSCRCDPCTEAWRLYCRTRQDR